MQRKQDACQTVLQDQSYWGCYLLFLSKKIKEILYENLEEKKESVEFLPVSIHSENNHDDVITLIKGSVKIEFNCHTGHEMIEPLIKAFLC